MKTGSLKNIIGTAITLPVFLMGILVYSASYKEILNGRASESWPEVTAVVTHAKAEKSVKRDMDSKSSSITKYYINYTLSYSVFETTYSANKRKSVNTDSLKETDEMAKHMIGSKSIIYYNPEKPLITRDNRGVNHVYFFILLFAGSFLIGGMTGMSRAILLNFPDNKISQRISYSLAGGISLTLIFISLIYHYLTYWNR